MINKNLNKRLNLLLEKVVETYAFKISHSKDCDNLAHIISNKCGESISGSTLKRLYGFMKTTSQPSRFTLNLLSRFTGYVDYDSFIKTHYPSVGVLKNNSIEEFLAVNNQMIKNLFSFEKGLQLINQFLLSKFQITAIVGEEGTGKTIFLASYLEKNNCNSTLVLFKISVKQILEKLSHISDDTKLVIIDDLEESVFNFSEIRQCIIEINKLISRRKKLKIILTISPYSWVRISEIISKSNQINKWGYLNLNATNPTSASNINSFVSLKVKSSLPVSLQTPLMLKLSKNITSRKIINEWGIVAAFFKQKVWETAYAYEKQQFFEVILEQCEWGKKECKVERKFLEKLIVKYKKAHLDLVTSNILSEQKVLNKFGGFKSHYQFGKSIFCNFLILSKLLDKYDGFNRPLLDKITTNYRGERKLNLLKLSVSFALTETESSIIEIFELNLSEYERQAIMIHLAHQFRENSILQNEILPLFVKSERGRTYFIERWINEEHLNGFYGNIIEQYLLEVSTNQDLIFGHALLYYSAFLNEKDESCELHYHIINQINDSEEYIHPFVLGRKYMTILLEEYRISNDYSLQTIKTIQLHLDDELKESVLDLPVHFSGFEHNILHAEFLTAHYHFTPVILQKFKNVKQTVLHNGDVDLILFQIFKEAFNRKQNRIENKLSFELGNVHPWYKYTVELYLKRLNN